MSGIKVKPRHTVWRLLEISGKRVRQIENDLRITPSLLNTLKQRYRLHPETERMKASEERELEVEKCRLHREPVKAERELLNKVLKLFAEDVL